MPLTPSARERAHAEVTAEIVATARRQLAEVGASRLSLRSVARELGVVSSAVYRYVASRDELLTLLIVAAYDSLGERSEQALAASEGRSPHHRWVEVSLAIRAWAIEHPHEYALLYGTPVPGYRAPDATTGPGTRVSFALLAVVRDAASSGQLVPREIPALPVELVADFARLRTTVDLDVADTVLLATLTGWSQLFGLLSFELFSQTRGVVDHHEQLFREAAALSADLIGLTRGTGR